MNTLSEDSYNCLCVLFKSLNEYHNIVSINNYLKSKKSSLLEYLNSNSGFAKYLVVGWNKYLLKLESDNYYYRPEIILNLSSMLNHIQAERKMFEKDILLEIQALLKEILKHYSKLAQKQILLLNTLINKITNFVIGLQGVKVYLLECPIGNSISTELMYEKLKNASINSTIIQIALSRNDSLSKGITRKQLIESKLKKSDMDSSCLIIYIDEWISGSNFYNISSHIFNITKNIGCYFLPAAYLVPSSKSSERFQTFSEKHNLIINKLGLTGSEYRQELPFLIDPTSKYPFFFSEHDRLAGYRKMQILGSIFSTFDSAICELSKDKEKILNAFQKKCVDEELFKTELKKYKYDELVDSFFEIFYQSYEDYNLLREELQLIQHSSNNGDCEDLYTDAKEVTNLFCDKIEGRKAKTCFLLAQAFLEIDNSINPSDRYYFHGHVPVIEPLVQEMKVMHDYFIDIINI